MRRIRIASRKFELGVRRVIGRLRGASPGRTAVCVMGVATAVALLTVVTGLSLGLAGGATIESDDVDYWIVPAEGESSSVPLQSEGPRLGSVHDVAADLDEDDRVEYATPVAIQPIRIEHAATGEDVYVLAIGVVPPAEERTVAGVDAGAFDASYPHYANGDYDGRWTGEVVITPAVAERLNVGPESQLRVGGHDEGLTVVDVADSDVSAGVGEMPAIVMPLAELQTVTGTTDGDQADQILVSTTDPTVREELTAVYPNAKVVSRSGIAGLETSPTNLPFAMALAAAIVAAGVGVAFVATMMGLELTAGRRELATLAAIGFSPGSRALVVLSETLTVTALGGILGIGLGALGVGALNAGLANAVGIPGVAVFTPALAGYAFAVALFVGVVAAPYPLYLAFKTGSGATLDQ